MASPNKIGMKERHNWSPAKTMSKKDAIVFDEKPDRDWLNPISMATLQKAVEKSRKGTVVLNGVKYDYSEITWRSKVIGDYPVIKLKRADGGWVPFGYVSVKRIREFDFERGY